MPIQWWRDKQNVVYSYTGILTIAQLIYWYMLHGWILKTLCEVNTCSYKRTCCMITFMWNVYDRKSHKYRIRWIFAWGWVIEGEGVGWEPESKMMAHLQGVLKMGDVKNVLKLDCGDICYSVNVPQNICSMLNIF